jgi:hypothetical protein
MQWPFAREAPASIAGPVPPWRAGRLRDAPRLSARVCGPRRNGKILAIHAAWSLESTGEGRQADEFRWLLAQRFSPTGIYPECSAGKRLHKGKPTEAEDSGSIP